MMQSFTQKFLAIAEQYPQHIAVLTDNREALSYQGLKEKALSIAATLSPGQLVALNIEKSANYIAALLGCWFSGAAFMPLDPALPPERRAFILGDAKPDAILTAEMLGKMKPADFQPAPLNAGTRAYVIYTSGSTGQPKGVVVSHSGIVSMLEAQIAMFGLKPGSRSLFYLSTSFDASVSDIGTALLSGAALCIETGSKLEIANALPAIARERGITYMDIPPSLLRVLSPEAMPETLETIVIGGEPCPPETVREWARRFRVVNVYGPTEATICTSMCLCDAKTWEMPLIGNPLPGVDYRIIDEELYIGGSQLALEYLNRPELTAQKFVMLEGKRLYRTGDQVCQHADGGIEFLGRIDRQVKLRGQLVELEEIEAHIARQPGISRAGVIKRFADGREALVAFVSGNGKIDAATLKSRLKPVLPEWMIPTHISVMDKIPETAAGKIDFSRLRDHPLETHAAAGKRPPQTEPEKLILSFWQRILKRQEIGCDDDFFIMGGDSMAVLELTLEAEKHDIPLTPALIVEFPTIAGQAAWLVGKSADLQSGAMSASALRRDVAPDEEWQNIFKHAASRETAKKKPDKIFLTGATGFLGSRLLRQFLEESSAHFYVLVRAGNEQQGWSRLGLPAEMQSRITVLCGDISQPHLGLDQAAWDKLAGEADSIIHCGATVNMVLPYNALRAANVAGTQEIARLACEGIKKSIHYASTLSVFVSTDQDSGTVFEDDRLTQTKTIYGGYAQSKWAAEYFLHQAPPEACDISIYRLGLITGDTTSGACASRDFLHMFIHGILSLGSVPAGPHEKMMVDITPVDHAVNAMARLIRSGNPQSFHIANKKGFSFADILRGLQRRGHSLPVIPAGKWAAETGRKNLTPQESAAFMALCRCMPEEFYRRHRMMDLFQATGIIFDTRNSGVNIPEADDALLDLYLGYILENT